MKQDPEFFEYLKQTDEGLLDFGGGAGGESEEEQEEEGGSDDEEAGVRCLMIVLRIGAWRFNPRSISLFPSAAPLSKHTGACSPASIRGSLPAVRAQQLGKKRKKGAAADEEEGDDDGKGGLLLTTDRVRLSPTHTHTTQTCHHIGL